MFQKLNEERKRIVCGGERDREIEKERERERQREREERSALWDPKENNLYYLPLTKMFALKAHRSNITCANEVFPE